MLVCVGHSDSVCHESVAQSVPHAEHAPSYVTYQCPLPQRRFALKPAAMCVCVVLAGWSSWLWLEALFGCLALSPTRPPRLLGSPVSIYSPLSRESHTRKPARCREQPPSLPLPRNSNGSTSLSQKPQHIFSSCSQPLPCPAPAAPAPSPVPGAALHPPPPPTLRFVGPPRPVDLPRPAPMLSHPRSLWRRWNSAGAGAPRPSLRGAQRGSYLRGGCARGPVSQSCAPTRRQPSQTSSAAQPPTSPPLVVCLAVKFNFHLLLIPVFLPSARRAVTSRSPRAVPTVRLTGTLQARRLPNLCVCR